MPRRFEGAAAFRQSLEQRLRTAAAERGVAVNALRLKLVIERLLARLFAEPRPPWLVKGGYAMELRLRSRARTTKDLDLGCTTPAGGGHWIDPLSTVHELLQEAAARDLGDHLVYRVGAPKGRIDAAVEGGTRCPVLVALAGREYGRFHVDVGLGPAPDAEPERSFGDDLLGFAGVAPPEILLVPRESQFAEKLHAYTRPWDDRENTRTKDLVDLLLLIELGLANPNRLERAVRGTFADRPGGRPPATLPRPPQSWSVTYAVLAEEVGLSQLDLDAAFERLAAFCAEARLGRSTDGG